MMSLVALLLFFASPLGLVFGEYSEKEVDYFVNLIIQNTQKALVYPLPTNASEYAATHENVTDYGTFDYIITGAGSAGTVIAHRLSEEKNWKVLLLEAGEFGNNLTDIPNMIATVQFSSYDWGYYSTPQHTSCQEMVDHKCPLPRGKGIGGTSLINGLVYARGSRLDFDKWEAQGNPGWSYKDVLPLFKKSEHFNHRDETAPVDESVHGLNGELNVEYHLPRSPQLNAFLEANKELGLPIADYNAGTGLGVSPAQVNTKNGRRFDGGKAFIRPILNRPNLKVLPGSYVTKVLLQNNGKKAYGVSFTNNGKNYIAKANKEVIVSAGAFGSPQLLMLSGIGPKKHLESLNIKVHQNLEVGSTLRDHSAFFGLNFGSNYTEPIKPLSDYVKEYLNGVGPLAAPGNNQGVGFYESSFSKGTGLPDIEIMFIPANSTGDLSQRSFGLTNEAYEVLWGQENRAQSFIFYIIVLHAESVGTVRLKSNNPFDYPYLNTNFLSDPAGKDFETMYQGLQLALKFSETEAMKKIGAKLQGGPLKPCSHFKYKSEGYWKCALRQISMNLYHPVGTCPMGPDPSKGAVVNHECKVHGVEGLRVADASIFPFTLSGHPNAPCVMIGEKVSELIKAEHLH